MWIQDTIEYRVWIQLECHILAEKRVDPTHISVSHHKQDPRLLHSRIQNNVRIFQTELVLPISKQISAFIIITSFM